MKRKIVAGTAAALLLTTILTMTAFYISPAKSTSTIISYSPIELYQDTTLQNNYKFIGCNGFIVKKLDGLPLIIDLNGHKVIGDGTYKWQGILVDGSEYTVEGKVLIKNGEIEDGFYAAISVDSYGYIFHMNWVYVENIKTKGNNFCLWSERSWVWIDGCSFEEPLSSVYGAVIIDSDTKVAIGA